MSILILISILILKGLNFNVFNMIARMNEGKIARISCDCKCKFDSTTCNSHQNSNSHQK